MEHPESKCCDCGGPNVVWCAPNEVWNEVIRPNGETCKPMICPRCFIVRAEKAGVKPIVWKLVPSL